MLEETYGTIPTLSQLVLLEDLAQGGNSCLERVEILSTERNHCEGLANLVKQYLKKKKVY